MFDAADPDTKRKLMNSVATMGIAGNALCKLPLGLILDRFGPRVTSLIGSIMLIAGCCIMALCDKNDQYLPVVGYFLLGIAGPFIQMPCFQFSELFGARKASAMAYLITCFELSTGVFWVFEQVGFTPGGRVRRTGVDGGVGEMPKGGGEVPRGVVSGGVRGLPTDSRKLEGR